MSTDVDADTTVKSIFERASALLRAGDLQMAEKTCRDGLGAHSGDGNLLCLLGGVLVRQHRPIEAERALRSVVGNFPDFAKAQEELGNAMLAQHKLAAAAEHLQRAVALDPGNGPARYKLLKIQASLGHDREAADAEPHLAEAASTDVALLRAAELRGAGMLDEAERIYHDIIARDPNNAEVYRLMGELASAQEQFGDAVILFRRAVQLAPDLIAAWLDLGRALATGGDFAGAVAATRTAFELEPRAMRPLLLIADYFSRMGDYEAAIAVYREGLNGDPGNVDCLLRLGHALRTIGRQDQAVRAYRDAISEQPGCAEAYWSVANLKSVRFEPAEIKGMEGQLAEEELSDVSSAYLLFALGKAYEDENNYERAFDFYLRGNSVRRMSERYDALETEATTDKLIGVFSKERFAVQAMPNAADSVPIFVVGLPRSGSTLIEQVLASHSQVESTHELPDLEQLISMINRATPHGAAHPEVMQQLSAAELSDLGQKYLETTKRYRVGKPFFVDKMPNNFRNIGLIRMILPNAKVIDARRHPLDSCLGSFRQLFSSSQPFSYDLLEIGEYYLEYRRLMDHWHKLLPGYVLDLHYENMVGESEKQIRRLLDHCGLHWEDGCLEFHKTERAIVSASSEQVRQPIYASSVNYWRHYEFLLDDLIETLQPVLSVLPDDKKPAVTR